MLGRHRVLPLLALCWLFTDALAGVLHVPGDYPTIQAAILNAYYGDTVLVAPGTYVESINFLSKAITVLSEAGAAETSIQSPGSTPVATFANGETSSSLLEGFTLSGGSYQYGGGVYCSAASPVIRSCVITGNTADYGGGLYAQNGSSVVLEQCAVEGNEAKWGGGVCAWAASPELLNCSVSGNTASSPGIGGGIYASEASVLTIANSLISSNSSSSTGGGICVSVGCDLTVPLNNVIAFNHSATKGGGIGFAGAAVSEVLQNSILWGNDAPIGPQASLDFSASVSIAYSDVQGGSSGVYVASGSSLSWLEGMIDEDPLFESGSLSDYHLGPGSPCIDSGNPSPDHNDPEDPWNPGYAHWPALGALRNDMGIYGGGGAGVWTGIPGADEGPDPDGPAILIELAGNPVSEALELRLGVPVACLVELSIFDVAGRLVLHPAPFQLPGGESGLRFGIVELPVGLYMVRLEAAELQGAGSLRFVRLR